MAKFYSIEIARSAKNVGVLDLPVQGLSNPSGSLGRDGPIWPLSHDGSGKELGAEFQRGDHIYVHWEELSIGPPYCWLVAQIVGRLPDLS